MSRFHIKDSINVCFIKERGRIEIKRKTIESMKKRYCKYNILSRERALKEHGNFKQSYYDGWNEFYIIKKYR